MNEVITLTDWWTEWKERSSLEGVGVVMTIGKAASSKTSS